MEIMHFFIYILLLYLILIFGLIFDADKNIFKNDTNFIN